VGYNWFSFLRILVSCFKKTKCIMKQFLLVFLGGGLGSVFRYLISKISIFSYYKFPSSTLISNVIGCFILGLVLGYAIKNNHLNSPQTILLATGFCGGLTTFSTFAYENIEFIKSGELSLLFLYTLISLVLGFSAVFVGLQLVK
jgi:CrcB protein